MAIYRILSKRYPSVRCELDFKNPLQLLVATVLSAQCTDKRVNAVTPALFKKYKNGADFAGANMRELQGFIKSTGFYRAKAKNIKGLATKIDERLSNSTWDIRKYKIANNFICATKP